jgi:hypothetical protein
MTGFAIVVILSAGEAEVEEFAPQDIAMGEEII